jgi:hydroxyacylglutathione hydrolase
MRTFLLFILVIGLNACRPPQPATTDISPPETLPASVKELTPDQVVSLIQATPELVILDAREEWEIKQDGLIAGAIYVDYLNRGRFNENTAKLDPKKPTLLYCAIGERSRRCAALLTEKGFTQLSVLSGGFEAWLASGKTVQK